MLSLRNIKTPRREVKQLHLVMSSDHHSVLRYRGPLIESHKACNDKDRYVLVWALRQRPTL